MVLSNHPSRPSAATRLPWCRSGATRLPWCPSGATRLPWCPSGATGLTLALLAVLALAAGATPKETHKLGVQAIEAGRWADAVRFFRAAIAERPEEKATRIRKNAYLPHYYLGVALAEQGLCKAALDSWAESNKQGQIQKSDHAGDFGRRRQGCREHLSLIKTVRTEVGQILIQVGEASAALSSLSGMNELASRWNEGDPSFGSRQRSAEQQLADARRHFDDTTEGGELERLDAAKSLAGSALTALNNTLASARRSLGALNAATAAALEQLEEVEQGARSVLRSISDLAPYPRRLGSRVAAVNRTLNEIKQSKSSSSAMRLTELQDQLSVSLRALRRAARRPPEPLTRAVEAFLSGSYEDALVLLEDPSLADNERAIPHLCLLRAASRHALWVLGGEQDEALRELAAESIMVCAPSEPDPSEAPRPSAPAASSAAGMTPSLKFFSPRFIEFHGATLEGATVEGATLEGATPDDHDPDQPEALGEEPGSAAAESVDRPPESNPVEGGDVQDRASEADTEKLP